MSYLNCVKAKPSFAVLEWLESSEWMISVVVIAEIQEGAESTPSLARKEKITRRLADFLAQFSTLVMDWDADTALVWAKLRHSPEVKRQPQALWGNLSGFVSAIKKLNPWC
jgi:predicted nucleic acid-binding protein